MTIATNHDLPPVEYAQRSDPGRDPDKQINEDVAAHKPTRFGHLCVVCDGMGGHAGGREAAMLSLETIGQVFDTAAETADARETLRTAVQEANRKVFAMGPMTAGAGRPGSTTVALLLHARGVEIAHVGDSRGYLIHQGQITQITKDHSMVQQMVDAGVLTQEQAAAHPDANKITRALGMGDDVDVEVRPSPVPHVAGDTFVLCSDGLSDMVAMAEILQIAGSASPAQAVGQLVDLANARGGHDNITVAILRARESAAVSQRELLPTVAETVIEPSAPHPLDANDADARQVGPTFSQTPAPSPVSVHHHPSRAILYAGLALAGVGVAALAVAVYIHLRPVKRAPAAMVDPEFTVAPPQATSPPPPVVPAPPLTPLSPLTPLDAAASGAADTAAAPTRANPSPRPPSATSGTGPRPGGRTRPPLP